MTIQSIGLSKEFTHSKYRPKDLQSALRSGSEKKALEILIKTNFANTRLPNGEMPLHYAIRKREAKFVGELLEFVPFHLNLKDRQGFTPLDHAAITQDPKRISLLLSHTIGAHFSEAERKTLNEGEIKVIEEISKDKRSVEERVSTSKLHKAASAENMQLLAKLFNPRKPDEVDSRGMTPLHYAALYGKKKAFHWLLQQGARGDIMTPDRLSLLHFAAIGGDQEIVEAVLNLKTINVNHSDSAGRTPLHYAITSPNLTILPLLIRAGADPTLHCGGHDHAISPLEIAFHLTKTRGKKLDALQLSRFQVYLFLSMACSWASFYAQDTRLYWGLYLFSLLGKVSCFRQIYKSLGSLKAKFLFTAFYLTNYIPAINLFYRTWNACWVGIGALKGIKASWTNASFEKARPLRNVIIHTVNGIYLKNELADGLEYAGTLGKLVHHTFETTRKVASLIQKTFRILSTLTEDL